MALNHFTINKIPRNFVMAFKHYNLILEKISNYPC